MTSNEDPLQVGLIALFVTALVVAQVTASKLLAFSFGRLPEGKPRFHIVNVDFDRLALFDAADEDGEPIDLRDAVALFTNVVDRHRDHITLANGRCEAVFRDEIQLR